MFIFDLSSLPDQQTWSRFKLMYSKRIRRLELSSSLNGFSGLLRAINRIRSSSHNTPNLIQDPILPNLHTLQFNYSLLNDAVIFMHHDLQTLSIDANSSHKLPDLTSLLSLIANVPQLTSLTLNIPSKEEFVEPMATLLGNLPSLKSAVRQLCEACASLVDNSPILKFRGPRIIVLVSGT
ncbi:hypothetical protein D9758_004011 [Tetrapyrgos nigripes]|uniref:Uncharacterized protein n=1 Tax=Tetrapyrgos nigripes TaxID=182062 RepID=A0A8H5GLM1_9AGAR|nr:hypothetical protein D9758_004011 [Tetrapyrgos nigripes]